MIVHVVVVVKPVPVMAAGPDFSKQILSWSTIAIWHGRETLAPLRQQAVTKHVNNEQTASSEQ